MRNLGYLRAFKDASITPMDGHIICCGEYDFDAAYLIAKKCLTQNSLPDVLMASNDAMAFGILKALREKGIIVPKDVALVGYDDIVFPTLSEITLTTEAVGSGGTSLYFNTFKIILLSNLFLASFSKLVNNKFFTYIKY